MSAAETVSEAEILAQEIKRQGDEQIQLRQALVNALDHLKRLDREIDRIYHELGTRRAASRNA